MAEAQAAAEEAGTDFDPTEFEVTSQPEEIHLDAKEVKQDHWFTLQEHMEFAVTILSKTKFSEKLSDEDLLAQFRNRFSGNVPLEHMDCIFIHSLGPPVEIEE